MANQMGSLELGSARIGQLITQFKVTSGEDRLSIICNICEEARRCRRELNVCGFARDGALRVSGDGCVRRAGQSPHLDAAVVPCTRQHI